MDENPLNEASPNTSSLEVANLHTAKGDERLISVLYNELKSLKQEVHELKTQKIIDETQMPPELLEQSGMLPPDPTTVRRGRGFRPLLRSEIEEAIKVSPFCSDQAKHLGVSVCTYRKYAKPLGLWNPQPHHKGCKKQPWSSEKGKYPLTKILKGEFNGNRLVSDWMVKKKLLRAGVPEQCAVCGYNKKHMVTGRVPLLLDHMDGDRGNFSHDNIRLLCWNDTIECGRGYLTRYFRRIDPDWQADGK